MSRRVQLIVLAALGAILVLVAYLNWGRQPEPPGVSAADLSFKPLNVENPALKVHLLKKLRQLQYTGRHRNIFSAAPPPPAVEAGKGPGGPTPAGPALPPTPPPVQVPAKFFGYVSYPQSGLRRAFFASGEDVFIVGEGEILLSNYRLLRISNTSVEVEEIGSGRRATLVLDETAVPPV